MLFTFTILTQGRYDMLRDKKYPPFRLYFPWNLLLLDHFKNALFLPNFSKNIHLHEDRKYSSLGPWRRRWLARRGQYTILIL